MSSKEKVISVESIPLDIVQEGVYSILQTNPNSFTHGMFKYPCKFIPEIPRWAMKKYLNNLKGVIFDPFSGSGTTLLEANINGWDAWGTEIDDIAKLIIKVKTTKLTLEQCQSLQKQFQNTLEAMTDINILPFRPLINNLEHWFIDDTINKLGRIKVYIDSIEDNNVRDFFKLCFVSIVKRVSNADDTSPKPYVSNKIKKNPPTVEKEFTSIFTRYSKMVNEVSLIDEFGQTIICEGNALKFNLEDKIALAITSPPYINAFDYARTMRLENLWLETISEEELREKKKEYVGTEKINSKDELSNMEILCRSPLLNDYYYKIEEVDKKRALIVKKFFEDMEINLREIYEKLCVGGKYVIVIGNSNIRKVDVESWKVLEQLGNNMGYSTVDKFSYIIQNPYIRIPRNGKGGKINKDYILVLEKGD